MLIAQGFKEPDMATISQHEASKARRHRIRMVSSPWRCNTHRSQDAGHMGLGSDEIATGANKHFWDREVVVKVCEEHSDSCDGSTMNFAIPQIGLRVLLEPAINPKDYGCLSLHLVGKEDPSIKRLNIKKHFKQDFDLPE